MSYSPWDLHDNIEEQLTVLGFLPSDVEHSNEDIWTAFDQLVEKYQALIKENNAITPRKPSSG